MSQTYSGCDELDCKINEWLEWDRNEITLAEVRHLLENSDWDMLRDRLTSRLSFGTAGLRGVMQAGFNSMNDLVVIESAQGIAEYLKECFKDPEDLKRGVCIGYDGRYNSKRFAELSTCVFIAENIPVWLFRTTVPTPFIPFCITKKGCLAGIMVTASHNPKEDNGYKVYWSNGAQIIAPHDKNILQRILDNLKPKESSWNLEALSSPLVRNPYDEVLNSYLLKLTSVIPPALITDVNSTSDVKFVYTPMHGVGYPYVDIAMSEIKMSNPIVVVEQRDPDPEFPTVKFPNPEEGKSCLELSIKLAEETNCDLILANDPDADRLACVERDSETKRWKVFSGNELGALLGWWAWKCYRDLNPECNPNDCYMLASTVSSKILKSMAAIEKFNFIETLTGFKWMGNVSAGLIEQGKNVLFAFEEAIGFMFSPNVLDKDGVSAACHLTTMYAYLKKNGDKTLVQKLNEIYDDYGYHYAITSYYLCYDKAVIERIFERIRNFRDEKDSYPSSVSNGRYVIKNVRDLTTGYDDSQPNGQAVLPVNKSSQMITFTFENGVVVTLRTSGTEPKVKYYAEMCAQPEEKNWERLREILNDVVKATVDELLEPNKNNLLN